MSDLKKGMLVRHASLGLGKVVAVESENIHVFFETSEKRVATKLRLDLARPLLLPASASASAWLEGMGAFSHDPKTGRHGLAETWISYDQAATRFLEAFPEGFREAKDGSKDGSRRARKWRSAHEAFTASLGGREGKRLLAGDDIDELVGRALTIERLVGSLQPPPQRASLRDGLQDRDVARAVFGALFEVLAAPEPDRSTFEKLAAAVPEGASPAVGWSIATMLPFIAQPDRHIPMRPRSTCEVAARFGFALRDDARPTWATYSGLRAFAELLLGKLKALGATDFVDVESFLHVAGAKLARA
jgi:hypothetical protein